MTVPFDPSTLGTDLNIALNDYPQVWGLASGLQNLGNAHVRRLHCDPGGLFYDDDYGFNLMNYLNADLSPADIQKGQQGAGAEIEKDERVQSCQATFNFDRATETLFVTLDETLVTGQQFTLVIAATNVTVSLLSVNGVLVTPPAPAAATPNVQLVVGPPGQPGLPGSTGPQGPPGASGTPQVVLDYDENDGESSSGNEDVVYQRLVNFGDLPATITAELVGNVMSAAGTAIFQLRVGGTRGAADGSVVGTFSTGSATPVPLNSSTSFSNPNGLQLVKVTVKSSASSVLAAIYDRTVTFR